MKDYHILALLYLFISHYLIDGRQQTLKEGDDIRGASAARGMTRCFSVLLSAVAV